MRRTRLLPLGTPHVCHARSSAKVLALDRTTGGVAAAESPCAGGFSGGAPLPLEFLGAGGRKR